jgi:TRAP-type C4-dicarboxylate transport system permease small subunit
MSPGQPSERAAESAGLRRLSRIVGALASLGMALAAVSLLASFALIGWAVVMRYLFNAAPVWVDEIVALSLVALVMLAAAQALRNGEHIGVDLLANQLPPAGRRWVRAWGSIASGLFSLVLIVNGWDTSMLARMLGLVTEGSLELPTWWLMLLMPAGGVLLLLASIESLWRAMADRPLPEAGLHGPQEP